MPMQMYLSLQGDDRIVRYLVDSESGFLTPNGIFDIPGGPAPLAFNPAHTSLYVGRRDSLQLSSYSIDQSNGDLVHTGDVDLAGEPCYVSTDHSGRHVLSAYYQAGYCAVHPIDEEGAVGGLATEWLETGSGAHCFMTDPSNRYAYLPHIANGSGGLARLPEGRQEGLNTVYQYQFNADTGHLSPNNPPEIQPKDLDGPRHYRFHPKRNLMYMSNEQGGSVTVYLLDPDKGTLTACQTISTLPEGYSGKRLCSQIQIHPEGKYLYVGNRGHDSIASFLIDEVRGTLTSIGWTSVGPVPRAFGLDPTGNFLYVSSLEAGSMVSFRIDQRSGELFRLEIYEVGNLPMWVLIADLES